MSKQNSFAETAERFAEALAALIEHEDCPEKVYKSFTDFMTEFEAGFARTWTPQDEAASIRARLPYLLTVSAAREVKA